jgi:DNA-binding transcriptional LysR family regulator
MVEDEIKCGSLVEIKLVDFTPPAVEIRMYYQKHQHVQPKIKTFVELVKQML